MKKQILFLVMMLLPIVACAQKTVKIDNIYYKLFSETNEAEVINRFPFFYSGDIVIPPAVVYEDAEYHVTSIGKGAFSKSTELTSVTIPNSVTSIGSSIFEGCTGLTSIVVDEGNSKYDSRENSKAIIETASNKLLFGCQNTYIPNSVICIENSAFNGCSGLTSINIPNSVTDIGKNAFKDCDNLTKVELNSNAIVSKDYHTTPFINDIFGSQVEEYILGEDVKSIGEYAFSECPNLTTVHMSDGVTSIGVFAFFLCTKLTEINIPSSMTSIDRSAFTSCGLVKVEINSNTIVSKDYSSWASLVDYFGYRVEEYIIGDEVKSIGSFAFASCLGLTSVTIPNSVTSIGEGAFYCCYGLSSINIPHTVTSIGENAFYSCYGLLSIQVENGNTVYDSRENCNAIIKTADNTLLSGCQNTVIPDGVTAIGEYAFYNCKGLTSINIPNSVMNIGEYAFYGCSGLTSITIPSSVTSIGNSVFCGCAGLTAVSIPNSVTNIGQYAFASCSGLTSVTIPNSVTTIEDYAFFSCSGLTSFTIPISVKSIGYRVFNNCSGLTEIQVESGNTVYDSRNDCNAIIETVSNTLLFGCQKTIIPNGVTSIGECAFWGHVGLTEIIIPNSVTSIGTCAFTECTNLTSVCIPNSVTTIGYAAFNRCSNMATVVLPNSVTTIGDGAFSFCGIKEMFCYAEQLPVIGSGIFQDTYYKETLHVPAGSIDAYSKAEQWKDFGNIVALTDEEMGVENVMMKTIGNESIIYDMNGRKVERPTRGMYIINGKKVVIN